MMISRCLSVTLSTHGLQGCNDLCQDGVNNRVRANLFCVLNVYVFSDNFKARPSVSNVVFFFNVVCQTGYAWTSLKPQTLI